MSEKGLKAVMLQIGLNFSVYDFLLLTGSAAKEAGR